MTLTIKDRRKTIVKTDDSKLIVVIPLPGEDITIEEINSYQKMMEFIVDYTMSSNISYGINKTESKMLMFFKGNDSDVEYLALWLGENI